MIFKKMLKCQAKHYIPTGRRYNRLCGVSGCFKNCREWFKRLFKILQVFVLLWPYCFRLSGYVDGYMAVAEWVCHHPSFCAIITSDARYCPARRRDMKRCGKPNPCPIPGVKKSAHCTKWINHAGPCRSYTHEWYDYEFIRERKKRPRPGGGRPARQPAPSDSANL